MAGYIITAHDGTDKADADYARSATIALATMRRFRREYPSATVSVYTSGLQIVAQAEGCDLCADRDAIYLHAHGKGRDDARGRDDG